MNPFSQKQQFSQMEPSVFKKIKQQEAPNIDLFIQQMQVVNTKFEQSKDEQNVIFSQILKALNEQVKILDKSEIRITRLTKSIEKRMAKIESEIAGLKIKKIRLV